MKKIKEVKNVVEAKSILNNAEFIDTLTSRDVKFGDRIGHAKDARYLAISRYGEKEAATMTDSEIESKFLEDGLVPVSIHGNLNANETIFLIHKTILRQAVTLTR